MPGSKITGSQISAYFSSLMWPLSKIVVSKYSQQSVIHCPSAAATLILLALKFLPLWWMCSCDFNLIVILIYKEVVFSDILAFRFPFIFLLGCLSFYWLYKSLVVNVLSGMCVVGNSPSVWLILCVYTSLNQSLKFQCIRFFIFSFMVYAVF